MVYYKDQLLRFSSEKKISSQLDGGHPDITMFSVDFDAGKARVIVFPVCQEFICKTLEINLLRLSSGFPH